MLKFKSSTLFVLIRFLWRISLLPLWAGLWLFGLSLLVWYPMRWWPGDRLVLVRLVNYFMPWLLVGLLPGLLLAGLGRRRWLMLVLAIPTLLIGLAYAPLFLPRSSTVLASPAPLKIMSYNVLVWNRHIPSAAAVIRREQPDILLMQEVTPWIARQLQNDLTDLYSGDTLHFIYESSMEQAIISRYPLTEIGTSFGEGRVLKARVDIPSGPITVWNVHANAPVGSWRSQYRQMSALVQAIAKVDGPLIVGGDFNTTDQSETYQLISHYLNNAHWQAGWGFGFSFPAHAPHFRGVPIITPMVRIDHIFYSHHFYARSASTLSDAGGSDHFPVIAVLSPVE